MTTIHVGSMSGGKDSTATAIIMFDRIPKERVRLVMADTGNEHPLTWDYRKYLEDKFQHAIDIVRADFTEDIARKRRFVEVKWREQGVPEESVLRALTVLVPTGNPYLDLCIWKGRFPSRRAQFCTEELKRYPLNDYQASIIMDGHAMVSWHGIRRDESTWRSSALECEQSAEGWWINRPIVDWTAQQTIDFLLSRGIDPNPLYKKGFKRVGCAPCINCEKEEVRLWSVHFFEVIDRIREWEAIVTAASKRQGASFFAAPEDGRGALRGRTIDSYVAWSKTAHGGRQIDLLKTLPPAICESSYGLCE